MIRNPGDEGPPPGQGGSGPSDKRASRPMAALRPWMGFGDPRIVRVSRTLGGKDRHSKVCTIRGLRDRRVRLSVPTALQLYGLQDRLGLSQPSKAVDWLLSAAQQEIDKLPPLQFPPGGFIHHPPSMAAHHVAEPHDQPISAHAMATEVDLMKENGCGSLTLLPRDHMGNQTVHKPTQLWSSEYPPRGRWKEHTRGGVDEKDGLLRRLMEQEHPGEDVHNTVVPVHPSLPAIASNNYPYASYYYNLEGSNISCVAHVGGCVMSQAEESHGHRQQQLLWCPPAMLPPMLSPNVAAQLPDHDPKHVSIFHMGSPTS